MKCKIYYLRDDDLESFKSSCFANCKVQHVSVHCCLVIIWSVKEANACAYSAIASALTGAHRDCLIVASFVQEPEIQRLVS